MFSDSRTADRITGLVLLALGIAMLIGGYTMDRLEIRQIHPASIPGLVPMGLGIAMIICAALLIASTRSGTGEYTQEQRDEEQTGSYRNLLVTTVLCVGYAAGALGKVPFPVATGLFIFLFSAYFSWPQLQASSVGKTKALTLIALFATVFALGISWLFRYGFLVRLP